MKKTVCFLMVLCLLLCSISIAVADSIDLSIIKTRATFSYDDSKNTSWVYYQYADKGLPDGTYVEFLVVDWGNNIEVTDFPEFRVFASTKANADIIVQSAIITIDGNMFELTFDELKLEGSHGSCFYLTSDAVPFMKSLATATSVSAILRYNGGTLSVAFTASEFAPVSQFAYDLLSIDFLNHIEISESRNESWYKKKTPIVSYVFSDVVLEEHPGSESASAKADEDKWLEYPLKELGLTLSLPSKYTVYTRGMSATDPALIALGMTPDQLDQALVDGNLYLEATQDDFHSEVMVTMIGSSIADFSLWSDSGLLSMSSMWTSEYASYGIEILNTDIFSANGIKYIRMYERQKANGSVAYRIQYYTTTNHQAINLVYVSAVDEITDSEKAFMENVVEQAVFGNGMSISDIHAFAQDTENFSYVVQEDGTACITSYNGLTSTVAIPDTIDGHSVTSLSIMEYNGFVANIYIPDSVLNIDGNPFINFSSLKSVTVSDTHPSFVTIDGILYSHDMQELICYPAKHAGDEFTVPEHVTIIGKDAFHDAAELTQLELPEGLVQIGDNAFYGVSMVPTITIPSSVTTIGINPFQWMSSLEEIFVSSGNKTFTVQQGALYNRKTNVLIAFPRKYVTSSFAFRDGIVEIGAHAFEYVTAKIVITFPDSVTSIGDDAFYNCKNMTFTNFPVAIDHLGSMAFSSSGLEYATIPGTIRSFGSSCFNSCALKQITIRPGVTEIPLGAFVGCDDLTEITLPETIVTIGNFAFRSCKNLKTINIPASVTSIGENVFEKDDQLTVFVVKDTIGETYCANNGISYQFYEADTSTGTTMREYTIDAGPFTVTLDENKYNILVAGMDTSEPAVIRSGIDADFFDTYMSINNKELLMFDISEHAPAEFDISIRIKDNKYSGVDLRECSASDASIVLDLIYSSFDGLATDEEIQTINGVPYLIFRWMNGAELRYATIVAGDMIYIWAERDNGTITDDDAALLLHVVESIRYPS